MNTGVRDIDICPRRLQNVDGATALMIAVEKGASEVKIRDICQQICVHDEFVFKIVDFLSLMICVIQFVLDRKSSSQARSRRQHR